MRQLLVLTADDWMTLRQGGTIPFRLGEESYDLITEAGLKQGYPKVVSNGASAPPDAHAPKRRKGQRYTMDEKQTIVAALDTAIQRGETQRAVLERFGLHRSSTQPYVWRKQLAAEAKKKTPTKKGA
jgi:hypothetical protein